MKKVFLSLIMLSAPLMTTICFAESDHWKAEEYYNNSSSQKNAASDLLSYVLVYSGDNILDVGCGDGKITADLAEKAYKGSVVGLDISPAMIDFASKSFPESNIPNLKFMLGDAQHLGFENEFDKVFSFTTLQWIQDHDAFLKGASRALKDQGILAVTLPMGLPSALQEATREIVLSPEWSIYFKDFNTGWTFVDEEIYGKLLAENNLSPLRLTVVPQKDVFPSREVFEGFISQWFPYLRPLPQALKATFMRQVVDRFLELEKPSSTGQVYFKIRRLEVVAIK